MTIAEISRNYQRLSAISQELAYISDGFSLAGITELADDIAKVQRMLDSAINVPMKYSNLNVEVFTE